MADFNTAFLAQEAMRKSVASLFADTSMTDAGRVEALLNDAGAYANFMGLKGRLDQAQEFVAKIAQEAGASSEIVRKIAPAADREKQSQEAEERAAAVRAKLPRPDPDPELVGEETKKMQHADNAAMLKMAQAGLAEEVAKIRRKGETEHEARKRYLAEHPGFYGSLRKLAFGPENETFAKQQTSSAQLEVAEKTAEIRKNDPTLTYQQAYTQAIERTPGLMKRLLHGERGEA